MTHAERRAALEAIAAEVRVCTRCRLSETRTNAVPGEGHPDTEVVFVGEGPGFNEDRLGRPFVGRAGDLLVKLLGSIDWRRDEVFITNIVKCRPPDNRDPLPDEIAACEPYLHRQLEALDPALIVTLGRHSMGRFMPGARISDAHGTVRPVDPASGASDALVCALYHPAAALRTPAIERTSYEDVAAVPRALEASRARRAEHAAEQARGAEQAAEQAVGAEQVAAHAQRGQLEAGDVAARTTEETVTAIEVTVTAAEATVTATDEPAATDEVTGVAHAEVVTLVVAGDAGSAADLALSPPGERPRTAPDRGAPGDDGAAATARLPDPADQLGLF